MAILMAGAIVVVGSSMASASDYASICAGVSAAADDYTTGMIVNLARVDASIGQYQHAIFGTTPMYDPWSGQVTAVPFGYGQNWSNGLGGYIQSNNWFYNPNVMPGPTYLPMIPVYSY
jgi:hypothetical protein